MRKPTVTELIGMLDKPALIKWSNKIGLQGISLDAYREKSKKEGTSIHKQIENKVKKNIPFELTEYNECWDEFMMDKEIVEIEKPIETPYFIGRLDSKIKWNDKIYLCDFKSSDGVYFENLLQLTAYRMAEPCDFVGIIKIPEFTMKPQYQITDFKPLETILISLHSIYQNKELIKRYI